MERDYKDLIDIAKKNVDKLNIDELVGIGFLPRSEVYYLTLHYPPYAIYPRCSYEDVYGGFFYPSDGPFSLYIHIPFCKSHCRYCQYSTIINPSLEEMDIYLEYLEKEIAIWKDKQKISFFSPNSILIGGGTPSFLAPKQLARLLNIIYQEFDLNLCRQFSIEADPKTLCGPIGGERLRILKDFKVERICLGAQSFNDEVLRQMGRYHDSNDIKEAISQIKEIGFADLSIDLICGYPGGTLEQLIETLEVMLSFDIQSYQINQLRILPFRATTNQNLVIFNQYQKDKGKFPDTREICIMQEIGRLFAVEYGFKYNTIGGIYVKAQENTSFFIKDMFCDLNNILGRGLSAATIFLDRFSVNTGEGLKEYYSLIDENKVPIIKGKVFSLDDVVRKAVITPLRICGFVSKKTYKDITSLDLNLRFGHIIDRLKKYDLVEEDAEQIRLTHRGMFFVDAVTWQFFNPEYFPFKKEEFADGELNPFQ